jgi:hypothetical protein
MSGLIVTEGLVQLPPDSTGKSLRSFPITVTIPVGDGTYANQTVYQQVSVPVDAQGNQLGVDGGVPLNVRSRYQEGLLEDILDALNTLIALTKES